MVELLIGYMPLLLAALIMELRLKRGKKFAFPIACLIYFVLAIAIAIFMGAANYSSGDPQLVAGSIAENIVSALLRSVFEIPILAVVFWAYKWWESSKVEKEI